MKVIILAGGKDLIQGRLYEERGENGEASF
jgi:hypothetical protein